MSNKKKFSLKVLVVGEPAVGKTSVIRRFSDGTFDENYEHTIGADFNIKVVEVPEENVDVILTVWDIGGQERFEVIRKYYYEGSNAAFIVCDLTNKETFSEVNRWYADLASYLQNIPIALMANKVDLKDQIEITDNDLEEMTKNLNLKFYFKTSAKDGTNVHKAFREIALLCLKGEM
ncbi:MAG: Rab family GTPase [Candidatus Helarchaeota archaeon]